MSYQPDADELITDHPFQPGAAEDACGWTDPVTPMTATSACGEPRAEHLTSRVNAAVFSGPASVAIAPNPAPPSPPAVADQLDEPTRALLDRLAGGDGSPVGEASPEPPPAQEAAERATAWNLAGVTAAGTTGPCPHPRCERRAHTYFDLATR